MLKIPFDLASQGWKFLFLWRIIASEKKPSAKSGSIDTFGFFMMIHF